MGPKHQRGQRMKKIAIIEDDVAIGDMLQEVLQKEGYQVERAYSGTEARYLLERGRPDLILLDLMLPGMPGEALLPQLQGIPVIVISAKADVTDKVHLLLNGAADYVTKPFALQELLARIQVQLRQQPTGTAAVLRAGELTMDTVAHQVMAGQQLVHLTKTEYAILKLLLLRPGQAVSKAAILDQIGPDTPDCTDSSLKQHVSNLRKKLRAAGGKEYIQSVWGIGFRLEGES